MNGGSITAFLPKFVGFPPLRGLHSSTVQLRRAPVPGMACAGAPCRTPRSRAARGARDSGRHSKSPFSGRSCAGNARTPVHEKQVVRQAWNAARMRPKPPDGRSSSGPSGHPGQHDAGPAQVRTPRSVIRLPAVRKTDVSQLPPPPQPPPPPPQDDPPPQECPPEPESPPPVHQLPLLPLSLLLEPVDVHAPRRVVRRVPPLRAWETSAPISTTPTTARMMPTIMASPSFRSPEAAPRGRLALA